MAGESRPDGSMKRLTLPEVTNVTREADDIPSAVGNYLREQFETEVETVYPNADIDQLWTFRNKGYAGRLALPHGYTVHLEPKVEVDQLFGMLEYAYGLESLEFFHGLSDTAAAAELFDRIVHMLAKRVVRREREGLLKRYIGRSERSAVVRGRIDFRQSVKRPWDSKLPVEYDELTVDNEENRILLWTLFRVLAVGIEDDDIRRTVREAYRVLSSQVSLEPYRADDCVGRSYTRRDADYETLHRLCQLILDNTGPTHQHGDQRMVPFRVEMPTLYETFVHKWLDEHLPTEFSVDGQHTYSIGGGKSWDIDLVLYEGDVGSGNPICVADTKYSTSESTSKSLPGTKNISQVVSYALAMDVDRAFLVYPEPLPTQFDATVSGIRVQSVEFGTAGDLEQRGAEFRETLFRQLDLTDHLDKLVDGE